MDRRRVLALGSVALAIPVLAGCSSGFNAATGLQDYSGNGALVDTGSIQIDNATLVAGRVGALGRAAFLGTVYNPTEVEDELTAIQSGSAAAKILPDPIKIAPMRSVSIQTGKDATGEFTGLKEQAGTYVNTTLTFKNAGQVTMQTLIVPPQGYYAQAAPGAPGAVKDAIKTAVENQATETASPSATPTATPTGATPSPSAS